MKYLSLIIRCFKIVVVLICLFGCIFGTISYAATFEEAQKRAADLNGDGKINTTDLKLLVDQPYPERPTDGVANTGNDNYIYADTSGTGTSSSNSDSASSMALAAHTGDPLEIDGVEGWYVDTENKNNVYYIKDGVAVTGWQTLSRNGSTYRYYFYPDGVLCENLYVAFGDDYTQMDTRVVINLKYNYVVLYVKGPSGEYDTPTKAFICKTGLQNKTGTWSNISSSTASRWYHSGSYYYQYVTELKGTLVHSVKYSSKDINSLSVNTYGNLYTNRFKKHSLNSTVVTQMNCYLIYIITKNGYMKSQMTVSNTTKSPLPVHNIYDLQEGLDYDPSDPEITGEYYDDSAFLKSSWATSSSGEDIF